MSVIVKLSPPKKVNLNYSNISYFELVYNCFHLLQLGETALHNAAWHGFTNIVHVLCRGGATLGVQNKDGDSPLHCAAARGHIESAKILIEAGMPLDLKDKVKIKINFMC